VVGLITDILNLAGVSTVAGQLSRIPSLGRIWWVVIQVVKGAPRGGCVTWGCRVSDEFPT
jgi:hypothetical protein